MSVADFLRSVSSFRQLTPALLELLTSAVEVKNYPAKTPIIRRGEPGDAMYIIKTGEVDIPILDAQGKEKFVAHVGPGEWFGEMALLTGENRTAGQFGRWPRRLICDPSKHD